MRVLRATGQHRPPACHQRVAKGSIASIYALADWFSPADIEAPTLEWVAFQNRKTYKPLTVAEIPDVIFSEVMRDVDLAVSVAHAGSVDPEAGHSTVEMRRALIAFTLPLFKLTNVTLEGSHAFIQGSLGKYNIHLGSGVIHQEAGAALNVLPVHSRHRGRLFLPFVDEDTKTIWLTQAQIAKLFGVKQPAISKHLKNIFTSEELDILSVHSILEYTAMDGKTYITYRTQDLQIY